MSMSSKKSSGESIIPDSAVVVKVTSVISPFHIRIYQKESYSKKLDELSGKIQKYMKRKKFDDSSTHTEVHLLDPVIVRTKIDKDVHSPAWWCRGIITNPSDVENIQYNVFLPDYGISLVLPSDNCVVTPRHTFSDEYLTFSVGLHNVIPAVTELTVKDDQQITLILQSEWSAAAIQFTKDLLVASQCIYFDSCAFDGENKQYGEFYLLIDDEIISLSETLVSNLFAVYLDNDLLRVIDDPKYNDKSQIVHFDNGNIEIYKKTDANVINGKPNLKTHNKHKRIFRNTIEKDLQKILIKSNVKCAQFKAVADARFAFGIHQVLNSKYITRPKLIQSYIWPAIAKGLNVVAISPPDSGKTLGYVLPIASIIASYETLPKGTEPLALILCSSSSEVFCARALFMEYLQHYQNVKVLAGSHGISDKSFAAQVYNGCHILVATPPFLARFLTRNRKILKFHKLCHLVLDGADIILDKHFTSLGELFKIHDVIHNRDRHDLDTPLLQIVTVSRHWTSILRKFVMTSMDDPYTCIGSFMEAAVYAGIKPTLCMIKLQNKTLKVLQYIGDQPIVRRTMIICNDTDEVIKLDEFLQKHSLTTLLAHGNMTGFQLDGIKELWNISIPGRYPILICTDEVLPDLEISNIQHLIHYSIPRSTKSKFYYRFSTLMDNWKTSSGNSTCELIILLDETSELQISGVVDTMEKLGMKVSVDLRNTVERVAYFLDMQKKEYAICEFIKSLGSCPKKNSCRYRHCVLRETDVPTTEISMRISRTINVGGIYTLEHTVDSFQRVQILDIVEKDKEDMPNVASVRCIDSGERISRVRVSRLLEIPEELEIWSSNIVEVFITNLAPFDLEYVWNRHAENMVHKWLKEYLNSTSYACGKVQLCLGNTIWLNTLEIRTKLIGYPDLVCSNLKTVLLEEQQALENNNHLHSLYALCKAGGLTSINGKKLPWTEQVN
ncbi:putative ATP-dependent RNA helicase TDRD12 isoform X2 [Cephus cinctus]|uniref:RNA helicase n=1 Tax=Cephus cinctus TaxID=211228 RepID=A0AAJ7RH03_CEPCN|nr:putative ATP-dependent RNA helicase TDRD12 isoform X2 [Cephus cinctus]